MEKSCFWCKKNPYHVESNYILQPPKYLITIVSCLRYINNIFTKDRCSIAMGMTVEMGLHKFSLHLCILAIILPLSNVAKIYRNDSKIMEFQIIDTSYSSTAYVVKYQLIT